MTLDVCNEWVSVTVLLLEVHIANLHEALDLVTSVNVPRDGDRVVGDFVLECELGFQTEDEASTCSGQGFGLVAQLESLLREEYTDWCVAGVFHHAARLLDDLESRLIVKQPL